MTTARQEKIIMEGKIRTAIEVFEEETGLYVEDLRITKRFEKDKPVEVWSRCILLD